MTALDLAPIEAKLAAWDSAGEGAGLTPDQEAVRVLVIEVKRLRTLLQVDEQPHPPFHCNSEEDGLFERMGSNDPAEAVATYARMNGVGVDEPVWLGWGKKLSDSEEFDFELAHMEEWTVVAVYEGRDPDVRRAP